MRTILTLLLLTGLLLAVPVASPTPDTNWRSYSSPNQALFYRDATLEPAVKEFAAENERFLAYVKQVIQIDKPVEPVSSYIFPDWGTAIAENMQLPEAAIWNVHEEGVFERYPEQSLFFRRLVANSVDFLHNSVMNLLRLRFRGQSPHEAALILRAAGRLGLPQDMMFRPTSQDALATFSSFFAYLLDTYGPAKLQSLLAGINDANYFFVGRSGEGRNTILFPQTIQAVYHMPLENLSTDWQIALRDIPRASTIDPKVYLEVSDYVNVISLQFVPWQDFFNFNLLMRDMAQLFYYFERQDMERSQFYIERINKEDAEGRWVAGSTTRTVIWISVAVGLLIVGLIALLLYRDYHRRQQMRRFLALDPTDQRGFDEFLRQERLKSNKPRN